MSNDTYAAPFEPLTHIIGNFVKETCHKWVHGSVQLLKKNNEDFVINSFQDNEQKPL
jgi:hypothetical protein